jgi:anti-anti-sigma factor
MQYSHTLLDIDISREGAATVVALDGEVDISNAPILRRSLRFAAARHEPVVVDLSRCRFLECMGVKALLEAWGASPGAHSDFVIACMPAGAAARALHLSAPGTMRAFDSREDAVAAFPLAG